ncbi:hypothetical protein ACKTEK_05915 [Tepidamorphus sp. 3E244]|uniref:hypothetical protein n=1 Tax=Tepidamorphus sp. 3E244 TaxID=3385498 RepID=UPI0038FD2A1C
MDTLIFQSVLLLLAAFIGGCMLGCWMKRVFSEQEAGVSRPVPDRVRASPTTHYGDDPVDGPAAYDDIEEPNASDSFGAAGTGSQAETRREDDASEEPKSGEPDVPGVKPAGLSEPDAGGADDLKRISGVGKKLEEKLNEIGIFQFRQIAAWNREEIDWVNAHIGFPGRIERDAWQAQADAFKDEKPDDA